MSKKRRGQRMKQVDAQDVILAIAILTVIGMRLWEDVPVLWRHLRRLRTWKIEPHVPLVTEFGMKDADGDLRCHRCSAKIKAPWHIVGDPPIDVQGLSNWYWYSVKRLADRHASMPPIEESGRIEPHDRGLWQVNHDDGGLIVEALEKEAAALVKRGYPALAQQMYREMQRRRAKEANHA